MPTPTKKQQTPRATALCRTGIAQIDDAVNLMVFDPCNTGRACIGAIVLYLWENASHVGTIRELSKILKRSEPTIQTAMILLREFGLVVVTKQLGDSVYKLDLERLARPLPYKTVVVHRRRIGAKAAAAEAQVKANRQRCSECGCPCDKFFDSLCRACDLRLAVNSGRLEVITVNGRV